MFSDPVEKVTLASSNLASSISYWNSILGLKIFSQDKEKAVLGFHESQAKLEFFDIGKVQDIIFFTNIHIILKIKTELYT